MLKKSLLAITCLFPLAATSVQASPWGQLYRSANVVSTGVQYDTINGHKVFWVQLSKGPETHESYVKPACHTGPDNRVIYDLNEPTSEAAMSLILAAYATGKKIDIDAYSTCLADMATVRNTYFSVNQ